MAGSEKARGLYHRFRDDQNLKREVVLTQTGMVLERNRKEFDPPLDPGIENAVQILWNSGIETFESCQGGNGHTYPEPAIRFHGERSEGFKALAIALEHSLPVASLRRVWTVNDGEPVGPCWEMVFYFK